MNAVQLESHLDYLIPEYRIALLRGPGKDVPPIYTPVDMEIFVKPMRHYAEEHFVVFHMSVGNHIIGYQIVSRGTLERSPVHPREVFKAAILNNSHSIMVAHNHPSGSTQPAPADIEVTQALIEAGNLLFIPVIDHLIVTSHDLCSMRRTHGYLWS